MNLKLCKKLRRMAKVRGARVVYSMERVVKISPAVEGYFWKPHGPIDEESGMRLARMPRVVRPGHPRAVYKQLKKAAGA